jgi:Tfp pilus assembly protein PilO
MQVPGENAMKNIPKEKRNQLILVAMIFAMVAGGWYAIVFKSQKVGLSAMRSKRDAAVKKFQEVKLAIKTADQVESELCDVKKRLEQVEDTMATGDLYSWTINLIRQFKLSYKVEVPQFSQIDGPRDTTMLPNFPYKQATLTIGGTAHFHDFGKFVADFEIQFPYMRLMNVTLEPASGVLAADKERLSFRMEIATLVKPPS